jgi:hypothetical protein
MSEFSRRSLSPLIKSKNFITDSDKNDITEEVLDQSDETREVASQLALIRKRHDKTKESNIKKRMYSEKLKLELEKASSAANMIDVDSKTLQQKIEALSQVLEQNKLKHDEEMLSKKSYLYMLDRMKREKIAMEVKANSLQTSLKSTKLVLNAETDKFRKVRESQYHSRVMLQEIKQTVEYDQKKKNERLQQLEKNLKQRQEVAFRREERQKRQAEISEAAANDDKDSQELKLRETLLLNRMWYVILTKRYELEVKKSSDIEQAFQKIKINTGLNDINDVIEKFLTKEQTYNSLLSTIAESEKKLESLKEQNASARNQLKGTQLEEPPSVRKIYSEIEEIEKELSECYKEYSVIKDKLEKSIVSYNMILNWGEKIFHTLDIPDKLEISPGSRINETKNTLEDMFSIIYNKLEKILPSTSDSKEQTQRALDVFARRKTQDIVEEITEKIIKNSPQPEDSGVSENSSSNGT